MARPKKPRRISRAKQGAKPYEGRRLQSGRRRGEAAMARSQSEAKVRAANPVSTERAASVTAPAQRPPLPPPPRVPSVYELFAGPRPASFSRGLEPAFLLIERDVMDLLRTRAAELGLSGYDALAKRILREHVHEY